MSKSKIIRNSILIIFVLLAIIYAYPKRILINEEVEIYKHGDPNFVKTSNLKIEGKFNRNLFKEDIFYGEISIDNIIDPTGELWDVKFHDGLSYLIYDNPAKGLGQFGSLGMILIDRNFDEFCIFTYDSDNKPFEILYFTSYPSNNRESSIRIFDKLKMRDSWLSHAVID